MTTKINFECFICQTEDVSVECTTCDGPFCKNCDIKFHNHSSHPKRQKHIRKAIIVSSSYAQCDCCGSENAQYFCTTCEEQQHFCEPCDGLFHSSQERQDHVIKQIRHPSDLTVDDDGIHCYNCHSICMVKCKDCRKSYCSDCDEKYHDYPDLEEHIRKELKRVCSICEELFITVRCDECSGWYCDGCDEARHKNRLANHTRKQIQEKSPKEEIIFGLEEQNKQLTKSVEEYKTTLEQLKVEKESLEKENGDLQNQIKELEVQVTEKEPELMPQNKEGTWEKYSGADVPEDGVIYHDQQTVEYVCRADVGGEILPGFTWCETRGCYVHHNGNQHHRPSYEVLVPSSAFEWTPCHRDEIHPRAVPGGKTKDGEVVYIGRIKHTDGHYRVGKVQPSQNGCYNHHPRIGAAYTFHTKYDILVWK